MNTATVQKAGAVQTVGDPDLFEIINGQRIGLPPMGIFAVWIASHLLSYVANYARQHQLGRALCEALFHLPLPEDRNRRPDVAFVSYQRWPKNRPIPHVDNAWDVVPDLAVEVISPTDIAEDLQGKVAEYFRAGVTLVWVVYPLQSQVYVFHSATEVRILTAADELDGESVLPGFRLALTELFAELGTENGVPS